MTFVREKVALITGGASGIGLAVTKIFLENGVKGVAIVDISGKNGEEVLSSLQKLYGEKVIFIKADVSKEKELRNAFQQTLQKFRNIDIVFNNAGITDEIDWERTVNVNLVAVMRGTLLAIHEYFPKYKSSDETLVINTASVVGIDPVFMGVSYCTTKHAVIGLGKALREDEGCKLNKTRVLTICPGAIQTPALEVEVNVEEAKKISEEVASLFNIISTTDYIAKAVLEIIERGDHGSIWVAENEEPPYEIVFPNRSKLRKIQ